MKLLLLGLVITLSAGAVAAQSVVITPKKTTYTRPRPITEFKKNFAIIYPRVKAPTPALSRRIENAISYQNVLGVNFREEMREVQWLEEADFEVNYNSRGLLCITLFVSGSSAYASGVSKTVVVDLKTGSRISAAAAFVNVQSLAAVVKRKQISEFESAIIELRKNPDLDGEDPKQLFTNTNFNIEDLDHFLIDQTGVTFIFDYGFPHVIEALEPSGRFKFCWSEIAQFVKPGGPLAKFLVR